MSISDYNYALDHKCSTSMSNYWRHLTSPFIAEYKRQYVNKTQQYTTKHSIFQNFRWEAVRIFNNLQVYSDQDVVFLASRNIEPNAKLSKGRVSAAILGFCPDTQRAERVGPALASLSAERVVPAGL